MDKELEKTCKEIYDFIKEWGADMAASELSAIAHMADKLTKEEIVARCVAIRNALWDLEEEKKQKKHLELWSNGISTPC